MCVEVLLDAERGSSSIHVSSMHVSSIQEVLLDAVCCLTLSLTGVTL